MGAVAGAAGVYGQYQTAKATQDALDKQRQAQAEEIAAKRDQALGERVAAARREAARRIVASGEAGVGGISAALDVLNTFGRANQDMGVIVKSAQFTDRASQASYKSELAGVRAPTVLDAGLAIAGGYASGHQLGTDLQNAYKSSRAGLTIKKEK